MSAVLQGKIEILGEDSLHRQVEDLVNDHEPADGWRFEEIDRQLFESWCKMLVGFRVEIDSFDLTANVSQDQASADRVGITTGLLGRSAFADKAMATIVDRFDGSAETLLNALSRAKLDGK